MRAHTPKKQQIEPPIQAIKPTDIPPNDARVRQGFWPDVIALLDQTGAVRVDFDDASITVREHNVYAAAAAKKIKVQVLKRGRYVYVIRKPND